MAAGSLVIVPEPHKADLRRSQDVLPNGQQQQPVSRSGGRAGVTQAVEVKSSQPIFPGQSPALARTNDGFVASTPQPPPRQSSQPPSRSSSSSNRNAFPGQTPTNLEFREPYSQLPHHSQQQSDVISRTQASPVQQVQQKVFIMRYISTKGVHNILFKGFPTDDRRYLLFCFTFRLRNIWSSSSLLRNHIITTQVHKILPLLKGRHTMVKIRLHIITQGRVLQSNIMPNKPPPPQQQPNNSR